MTRIAFVLSAVVLLNAASAHAQDPAPIKRVEFGVDVAVQQAETHVKLRRTNAPVSIRYGAVNSQYRFTIDQRVTMGERRLVGGPAISSLDTQLGWRLGSRERLNRSVLGPYLFGGINLTSKSSHFRDPEAPGGPLFGYAAGVGTRLSLLQTVIRPEVFVAYDHGSRDRDDTFWLPSRTSFGVRFGYGFAFPIANE